MVSETVTIPEEERRSLRRASARERLTKGSMGMLNIVPMLDILFNLLIFFLCFGLALVPEGALPAKLPASHGQMGGGAMPLAPVEVHLQKDALTGGEDYASAAEHPAGEHGGSVRKDAVVSAEPGFRG